MALLDGLFGGGSSPTPGEPPDFGQILSQQRRRKAMSRLSQRLSHIGSIYRGQPSRARKRLGVFKREMDQVTWARTLDDVRALATERARVTKSRTLIERAKREGDWTDIGALKMLLRDDLLDEQNVYARKVMADIESRKGE